MLPVCAGLLGLLQRVVGMGEPVLGASLIEGLAEFAGECEGLFVVGEGDVRVAGGVLYPAQALPCLELPVAVAAVLGESE